MILRIVASLAGVLISVGILGTPSAVAQSIYRCEIGGKTSYSDRPCSQGATWTISPNGQPTPEERAAARARLQREMEQDSARWQERRARELAAAQADAERRAKSPAQAPDDPRDNEKVMVHTSSGWDYKTRKQLRAEEEARAVRAQAAAQHRPPAPPAHMFDQTGRMWLNQGGTVFDPATGRRCVNAGNVLVNCF